MAHRHRLGNLFGPVNVEAEFTRHAIIIPILYSQFLLADSELRHVACKWPAVDWKDKMQIFCIFMFMV